MSNTKYRYKTVPFDFQDVNVSPKSPRGNHTDSKSLKMETANQISEYGRVEISKNISKLAERYVSATTVFLSLGRYQASSAHQRGKR